MKRLYTFGCSFTSYLWPTWADILGKETEYFENWGKSGAGNQFIFNSLNECIIKNKLTSDDQIIIMWSNTCREDRYVRGRWLTPGNIYNQAKPEIYNTEFIKNFADPVGYLIRDLSLIHASAKMLEKYNIPYIFTSMIPIVDNSATITKIEADIIDTYEETLKLIRPSVYETIFNSDWQSRSFLPDPAFHKNKYNQLAGTDWPIFDDYQNKKVKNVSNKILNEIKYYESVLSQIYQYNRLDNHPSPMEHLEFIDIMLPEFSVSNETRLLINKIDKRLTRFEDINDMWKPIPVSRW